MTSIIPQWGQPQDYLGSVIRAPSSSALNDGSMGYPSVPSPAAYVPGQLGNSYASPVTSSVLSNGSTTPVGGSFIAGFPSVAAAPDLSSMGAYAPTTSNNFTPATMNGGFMSPDLSTSLVPTNASGINLSNLGQYTQGGNAPSGLGSWFSSNKDLITGGVGLATAGLGAFNAWNTNKTARDQLNFQKDSFSKQYEAQKGLTNSELSDRQAQRVREHPGTATSVNDYMKQYGVK